MTQSTLLVFGKREFKTLLDAPGVRARLERSAECFAEGTAAIRQPWYQPLPEDFPVRLRDAEGLFAGGLPGFPL